MLDELSKYINLGTPNYFLKLLNTLRANQHVTYTKTDIDKLFYNRIIDGRSIFDGCIELGLKIDLLLFNESGISINNEIVDSLESSGEFKVKFVEYLFYALKEDVAFEKIFCSDYLSHDVIYNSLTIDNRAFGFKFSNFKQLLIDFDVIRKHPQNEINCFLINNYFKKIFDKTILPEIKKRKISIDELRRAIEQKQFLGEEAEKYVLKYEFIRLKAQKEILWVAEYIVNEGYDIASYNNEFDHLPNRFIEVKSYQGEIPYFFWSRNEYSTAKQKKNEYWLYLINYSEMHEENYIPIMIQNPFDNIILSNEKWNLQIENYKIELIKNYRPY